jgi:hypothetical protein
MRTLSIRRQAGCVAILIALAGGVFGCAGKDAAGYEKGRSESAKQQYRLLVDQQRQADWFGIKV